MAREQLQTLTEPMFYILLSLKKPRYGIEIMAYVDQVTSGRIDLGPGTVYALLARFESEGYIALASQENKRKHYQLTPSGEYILAEEVKRLELLLMDYQRVKGEE